jgi:acyl carrier protein
MGPAFPGKNFSRSVLLVTTEFGRKCMDEIQARLMKCFLAVFPDLTESEVARATSLSVEGWDSLASLTLLTVLEEEFAISIDPESLTEFVSFEGVKAILERSLVPGANQPET